MLIVPRHGSKTSSTPAFIQAVSPKVSIFTPGYLNRYKHATPEVLARYQAVNNLLYPSDYHSALILQFKDKNNIHISPWREMYQRY